MKVIADRKLLSSAINLAHACSSARSSQPILACLCLSVDEHTLVVRATNGKEHVRTTLTNIQVESQGTVYVNAEKIKRLIETCDDEQVTLESNGDFLFVRMGDGFVKLQINTGTLIDLPKLHDDKKFISPASQVLAAIEKIAPFASVVSTNSNYVTHGVQIDIDGTLSCSATDCKLAGISYADVTAGDGKAGAFVPTSAINLLRKLDCDTEDDMTISISQNAVIFSVGDTDIASGLLEAKSPPTREIADRIKSVVPVTTITANRADMRNKVQRASINTTELEKGLTLSTGPTGVKMSLLVKAAGDADLHMDCEVKGPPMSVNASCAYILKALNAADEEMITLDLSAPNAAIVMKSGTDRFFISPINKGQA